MYKFFLPKSSTPKTRLVKPKNRVGGKFAAKSESGCGCLHHDFFTYESASTPKLRQKSSVERSASYKALVNGGLLPPNAARMH